MVQINIINYIINYEYFLKHGTTFFSNVPNSALRCFRGNMSERGVFKDFFFLHKLAVCRRFGCRRKF